ncbi:MAG: phosphoribosylanthranilate isomerase [Rhodospirillales bacterium]
MPVDVKICGLTTADAVAAAVEGGARYVGFVFFPPSPRSLSPAQAAALLASSPRGPLRVGLFVDADDALIGSVLSACALDMVQLHGAEPPARVAEVRARFGRPVIKAVAIADDGDLVRAHRYEDVADLLLFDARPPTGATRPGGNARRFDWALIKGRGWRLPWLLAGGIDADNLAAAVRASGARAVDVSSGVEDRPGVKNPARIRALLDRAAAL